MQTSFTKLLNIKHPIIQAPIGSATTPELAAAVSNAGGLGMLALSWKSFEETRQAIRKTKSLTEKPFGVNIVLGFAPEERVKICIEEKVPVVSFFWGDSTKFIQQLKYESILVCQTVGSSKEAIEYNKKGVDFLIAQGYEAGGHIWGRVATSVLVPSIVDNVTVPVIACGGIADSRGILAALSLGAAGVCMGTRFLMSEEAYVHPIYRKLISEADENDTLYVERLFNIGWDNAPHRILKNSTTKDWEAKGKPEAGNRPNENEIVAHKKDGTPIIRYSDAGPMFDTTGDLEALALYAGQSAGLCSTVKPAAEIMSELVNGMTEGINNLSKMIQ
jgi:nitronate monooxygenase